MRSARAIDLTGGKGFFQFFRSDRERPQVVEQGLPRMAKRTADDGIQPGPVRGPGIGHAGSQLEHRRNHSGERRESTRRNMEASFQLVVVLDENREVSIVAIVTGSQDTFGHLPLHHHGKALKPIDDFSHLLNNDSGDIVRKVSHQVDSFAGQKPRKGNFQDVTFHYLESLGCRPAPAFAQEGHELSVELDDNDVALCLKQFISELPGAGSDLKDNVILRDPGKVDNAPAVVAVDQKVLTERFLGFDLFCQRSIMLA